MPINIGLNLLSIQKKLILALVVLNACQPNPKVQSVSTADFRSFIDATGYTTDAEKYGWSIVQNSVFEYESIWGANWKKPDGKNPSHDQHPVTQVSYNDAIAYCKWANVRLPSYEEYWIFTEDDQRIIHISSDTLLTVNDCNFRGNTWDITNTLNKAKDVRLAGGSYFCNENTCDGTNPKRELFVSRDTGNSNISFLVVI